MIRRAVALCSPSLFRSSSSTPTWRCAAAASTATFHSSSSSCASGSSRSYNSGYGIAGVVGSFSLIGAIVVAEAKERPSNDLLPKECVLYQYEACPFCNKVKAFLDYNDIPYRVVEVHPFSKKEIKWSDYKKVPILVVDGEQLVDSSDIVEKLNHKIHAGDYVIGEEEKKWRRWVDDHLVHLLSPNIYRNTSEALESFDYIANNGNFSYTERLTVKYAGAAAMYMISKKLKKKYSITDERAALYEAAETWSEALDGRDFLGGSKPNLADLAVFGVLRPIRYLKSGRDMIENTSIGEWYQRMENTVGDSSRIQQSNATI